MGLMINDYYEKFEEAVNEREKHQDEYDELKDMIKYDQGNTLTTDAFGGGERRSIHQAMNGNQYKVGSSQSLKDNFSKKPLLNFMRKRNNKNKQGVMSIVETVGGHHDL